jgi:hypothetical protein
MRRFSWLFLAALAGCTDSVSPVTQTVTPVPVPNSQLHIVVQDTTAPALLNDSASFYAVVGQHRRARIYYQGAAPGDTGETLLEFEVPGDGLYKKPDGTTFASGDSVLITITVTTPGRMVFTFSPSGLQFSPSSPARLHIEYAHGDHDFNDDGHVDSTDTRIQSQLDLWRRETGDTVWVKLGGVNLEDDNELDANVPGFTEYALAW